jgi:RHS repeat-associated protein
MTVSKAHPTRGLLYGCATMRQPSQAFSVIHRLWHIVCVIALVVGMATMASRAEADPLPPSKGPSYASQWARCEEWIANGGWYIDFGHYGFYADPHCADGLNAVKLPIIEIQGIDLRDGHLAHMESWEYESLNGAPDRGKGLGAPCNCAGDPIDLTSGNEYLEELDYTSEFLSLRRFYNSTPGTSAAHIGPQWRTSFDASLRAADDTVSGVAIATRPDGRVLTFYKTNGVWASDADVHDRVVPLGEVGNRTGWTYFDASAHVTEVYDAKGLLQSKTDANGLAVTFAYSTAATPATAAPTAGLLLSATDPHGRQLLFTYTSSGSLDTVTLPDGHAIHYAYDASPGKGMGNLLSVTYPGGTSKTYLYNERGLNDWSANMLTGTTDEGGNRYSSIGYGQYAIDGAWRILAKSSSLGQGADVTNVSYSQGQTTVTYPSGATVHVTTAMTQNAVHVTALDTSCGPACHQPNKAATYDAYGHVSSTADFNGNVTGIVTGADGLVTQRKEAEGTADERTIDTTWDASLRLPLTRTVKNAAGTLAQKRGWAYNATGQTTAECLIDPAAAPSYTCSPTGAAPTGVRRTVFTYCTAVDGVACPLVGLILTSDGPRTDVADTLHYAWYLTTDESGCGTAGAPCHRAGDLESVTDGVGLVTSYLTYDHNGRPTRTREPNGTLTDLTYTPRGWLATKTVRGASDGTPSPTDATTTIGYNPDGTIHQVTDPDGVATTYLYDGAHRLTDIVDAVGNRQHYTLDSAGNRTKTEVINAAGTTVRSSSQAFNTLGQLTSITDGLGRTVFSAADTDSYDANGNLVHTRDGLGIQQKQVFDGLNRLVSTIRNYQGSDPATKDTQSVTSYDELDNVTGFSDPDGLNTTYDLDALGNLTGQHSPDTGATTQGFDISGNPTSRVDAANVSSTSSYDAVNRLISTTYADPSLNIAYKYDEADSVTGCTGNAGKGRLTRVVEDSGGLVYCYDSRGNLLSKRQTVGLAATTTRYTWTLGNRLASVTTPSGTVVTYARNAVGRIVTVAATPSGGTPGTIASAVTYQPFGPVTSYTLGSGQTITRTFDSTGQLTDIVSPAFSLHLARDAMGNITAMGSAAGASPVTETYAYDPLYRLTGVNDFSGNAIEAYTYNKTGDRLSKTAPGLLTGTYSYTTGTHQLVGVGTTTRQVDARGNTTANALSSGTFGFSYNARNRLSEVQNNGVTVARYVLNAEGQRVQKTANGTATRFDYDEHSHLISEATGTTTRDYVWLDDLPVGVVDRAGSAASLHYIHADGLGSPRAVSDATGAVQWRWDYAGNPFGEKAPTSDGGYVLNLRYPGQYFDAESGLNYNVNRDYEAATGRYLQSDPLGIAAGPSTFSYVDGNPLTGADPLGLCKDDDGEPGEDCEKLLRVDTDTCNAITRRRGGRAGAACHESASERYAACLRGRPIPNLNTWNNREALSPTDWGWWEKTTGLTGAALGAYLIISEGSRLFPPRNAVPIP